MPTYVQCPIEGTDTVVYLTHAGFTPSHAFMQLSTYDQEYKLIWDRAHLKDRWPQEYKNIFIIHGHTPVQFMQTYAGTEVWNNDTGLSSYANGHKINLDLGVPSTGIAALYCIDTMCVQEYFVAKADFQD